jgi:hypothetical protein
LFLRRYGVGIKCVLVGPVDALPDIEVLPGKVEPFSLPADFADNGIGTVYLLPDRSVVGGDYRNAATIANPQLIRKPLNHHALPKWDFLGTGVLVFKDNEKLAFDFEQSVHV